MTARVEQSTLAADATTISEMPGDEELCRLSARELAQAYADRRLSPVDVTHAALARAEATQTRCNAFCTIDHDGALAAARDSEARWSSGNPASVIDGVPTTIKDNVRVAGWTMHSGTLALPGVRADADAPAAGLLRRAGAVLLGSTTMPEFGWKAVTDSPLIGITRNPHDPSLTTGGSSGGAAAAAACGAGVLHLGTDGGGSIRIPAAFCGVVGHKPSFGRIPAYPPSPFGTVAHLGPISRTVEDAAVMLKLMSGRDVRDWHQSPLAFPDPDPAPLDWPGLRVGVWREPPEGNIDASVVAAFDRAVDRLERAGAILSTVTLPGANLPEMFRVHWFVGAAMRLRDVPSEMMHLVDPALLAVAEEGRAVTLPQYVDAMQSRAEFAAAFDALLARHDVLLSPAVCVPPFAAGQEVPAGWATPRWTGWAGFSYPINLSQAPACVAPCDGYRAGLQFVAARGADHRALAAAAAWTAMS